MLVKKYKFYLIFILFIVFSGFGDPPYKSFNYIKYKSGIGAENPPPASNTGIIFYPGGNVDEKAYLPLSKKLNEKGYQTIITPMPFDLAVFGIKKASKVIREFSEIENWIIMGHSLGGVMAAQFASENPDLIKAIVFLASYPADGNSLADSNFPILSLYGSEDGLATPDEVEASQSLLPESAVFFRIEGGNHAQFGDYGKQKGDNPALISREKQMEITVEQTAQFIDSL